MELIRSLILPATQAPWRANRKAINVAIRIVGGTSSLKRADPQTLAKLTLHELLHQLVDERLGGMFPSTPLLRRYRDESLLVRRHLHVDALQKSVYLRAGWKTELEAIIANDLVNFGPDYSRAWNIVNQEGHEPFVRELQRRAIF